MTKMLENGWIRPKQLFDGWNLHANAALRIVEGRVAEVVTDQNSDDAVSVAGTLSPGFIDLQVNGGGDVLFNAKPTADGIREIVAAHRKFGTVCLLPTVITDAPEVLASAVDAVLEVWGEPGVLGIHIEGPHLSVPRRGTHAERFIRPVSESTIAHVRRLREANIPVMITVAPENATGQDIAALAATGAIVSIGHTDVTAEETRAALAAGAGCFTHLYNAMSPMLNREPGVVGAAINSSAYAGIICDGVHVADEMIGLALRARPEPDKLFLVSDAMPTVGGSDRFELYGMSLNLENGRLVNDEGSLAGAHVTIAESVVRMVSHVGVSPEVALRMATGIPARAMGCDHAAQIVGQSVSDLILLDNNWFGQLFENVAQASGRAAE